MTEHLGTGRHGRKRVAVIGAGALVALLAAGAAWAMNRPGNDTVAGGVTPSASATVPAGVGGGLMPCQNPSSAVTNEVLPGPTPARELGLNDGFTWYSAPAGYRFAAVIGWRVYTEDATTTCLYDDHFERMMSVERLATRPNDAVAYWKGMARNERANGLLPGYAERTIEPFGSLEGGAEWQFDFTPDTTPLRAVRYLYYAGEQAYVLSWICPVVDWQASQLPMIKLSFRPPGFETRIFD